MDRWIAKVRIGAGSSDRNAPETVCTRNQQAIDLVDLPSAITVVFDPVRHESIGTGVNIPAFGYCHQQANPVGCRETGATGRGERDAKNVSERDVAMLQPVFPAPAPVQSGLILMLRSASMPA
jgi:hypothetical protein